MRKHSITTSLTVLVLLFALNTTAFAYSHMKVAPIPFDYSKCFPLIVGGMLVIEGIIILLLTDLKRIVNVSFAVLVANAASFVLTRFAIGFLRHETFSFLSYSLIVPQPFPPFQRWFGSSGRPVIHS